jgi:hypothetical protein
LYLKICILGTIIFAINKYIVILLLLIRTTLEVDEEKENEDLSKQRSVCGDRECFSRDRYISGTIGKACLQHYVSEEYF